MIVIELLEAILKLGMPVFATSWWVIHRRYKRGDITREADRRTVKTDLKAYRKKWRSDDKSSYGLMENKWMRFGGGFYGITALTTFLLIELGEVFSFQGHLSVIGEWFDNGLIGFVVDIFVNQLENFVSAITWFAYWADEDRAVFIWVGIPYAAYLLGISHASGLNVDVSENLESGEELETRIEEKDDHEKVDPSDTHP